MHSFRGFLKSKTAWLVAASLCLSTVAQFTIWDNFDVSDVVMWSTQAEAMYEGDSIQYDIRAAYAHPGTPILLGTIALAEGVGLPYRTALILWMSVCGAIALTASAWLAYALRKNVVWSVALVGVLTLHRIFFWTTPPSHLASILCVLLFMYSWYVYEKSSVSWRAFALWGILSGILVATRFDIGVAVSVLCAALLIPKYTLKRAILGGGVALATFWIINPYMWYMPLSHIRSLFGKIFWHYTDFEPSHLPLKTILLSLYGVACTWFVLLFISLVRRRNLAVMPPIPVYVLGVLGVGTVVLLTIYVSADYQAIRYFQPLVYMWEAFLPLCLFALISNRALQWLVAIALMVGQVLFYVQYSTL